MQEDLFIAQKQAMVKELASELDRKCKEVAYSIKSAELAIVNDVSYQYIREILNTNGDQKPFQLKLVPSLIILNPEKFVETVLYYLCDLCGYEHPEKKRKLTPEEENKIIKQKFKEHGLTSLLREWGIE